MIAALALMLQAALPPKPIIVKNGATQKAVPVVVNDGKSFVRADLLSTALGGSISVQANGHFALVLPNARFEMIDGVPFAKVDSTVVPLAIAPERRGDVLFVPLQLVTEVIPQYGGGYFYDQELGELRSFLTIVKHPTAADRPVSRPTSAPASGGSPPISYGRPTRRLVVVDAGHGGPDRGMSGPIGQDTWFIEKEVTLAVARKLADALRAQGMDVLMTRTTDTLIGLYDRGPIANRNHGDLFISIHVNAPGRGGAVGARERGFETYFLAEAKTEEARRVELMENQAVRFETGANAQKGDPLSFIITDMAQNEHLRESSDLAQTIQDGLKQIHPGPSRGVQQANFAVLRGSFMPAVLVEIGFGTNVSEAQYLHDSDNQASIARNIASSILSYLAHYESRVGGTK
ncbi:MAG: N-acetylmuramoyl-L-alanine amidase [Gemmatimonadota bacterium]|nr:N-acetylmuramoyl-L-alanine amidase [Gemmatimonadota bacterium]